MASNQPKQPSIDRYVVIHVATTCDEHGVYVTKDSAEVIEFGWIMLDAKTCDEASALPEPAAQITSDMVPSADVPREHSCETCQHSHHAPLQSVFPIFAVTEAYAKDYLASLTTLTWEHVRTAGSFRDAINRFDTFAQEQLLRENLEFSFVTLDSWDLRVQLPREARDKAVVLPPYLQHSRTYDLRTEYQRWQQHHPSLYLLAPAPWPTSAPPSRSSLCSPRLPSSTTCHSTCKRWHQHLPAVPWKKLSH